jgi:short-subunit dehydrogenase
MDIPFKPLDQQVIVVTGASSGIGLATAYAAAERGARLVLAARSARTLADIAARLAAQGREVEVVEADVGDRPQVARIAERAIARFGRIDTWVNNAGVSVYGRVDEIPDADHERLFCTNFWGVVYGSLEALPHLRRQGGALINVGSEVSDAVIPLQVMYAASKHAVKGFTDGLRLELEADGAPVSVTLIQPTAVDTPYPENAASYLDAEPKLPTPMIEPEKVAAAILEAATTKRRDVRVGAMAVMNTTMAKLLPRAGDAMAKMQMGRQQRAEPSHPREGTLYQPGERGRVHGRGDDNAEDRKVAHAANVRPG